MLDFRDEANARRPILLMYCCIVLKVLRRTLWSVMQIILCKFTEIFLFWPAMFNFHVVL